MKRIELEVLTYDEMRLVRGGEMDDKPKPPPPPPPPPPEDPPDMFIPDPGDCWIDIPV